MCLLPTNCSTEESHWIFWSWAGDNEAGTSTPLVRLCLHQRETERDSNQDRSFRKQRADLTCDRGASFDSAVASGIASGAASPVRAEWLRGLPSTAQRKYPWVAPSG